MRFSSLFRSRWLALIWSAGIVWTAMDMANSLGPAEAPEGDPATGNGAAALNQLQGLVEQLKTR